MAAQTFDIGKGSPDNPGEPRPVLNVAPDLRIETFIDPEEQTTNLLWLDLAPSAQSVREVFTVAGRREEICGRMGQNHLSLLLYLQSAGRSQGARRNHFETGSLVAYQAYDEHSRTHREARLPQITPDITREFTGLRATLVRDNPQYLSEFQFDQPLLFDHLCDATEKFSPSERLATLEGAFTMDMLFKLGLVKAQKPKLRLIQS